MMRLIARDDMRVTQTLASGIIIRQDFRTGVRFVFFDTGMGEWQYATHGGTLFVVMYKGTPYGFTCRHVLKDFRWSELVVTDRRFGTGFAGLRAVSYPTQPREAAIDTDILDIAIIQFSQEVDADFFLDAPYIIDEKTITTSKDGDTLYVAGALKAKSTIGEDKIAPVLSLLELIDETPDCNDPTLRRATGCFDRPEFSDVIGLSGSPVFNVAQRGLCGIVVRGAMHGTACILRYVDMVDVHQLLAAVHDDRSETYYRKTLTSLIKPQAR